MDEDYEDDEYGGDGEISFKLTSPDLITFLWDLATVGKCWYSKHIYL